MTTPEPTRPNPMLALVYGLLCPGAGLLYGGRPRIAAGILVLYVASVVSIPLLVTTFDLPLDKLPGLISAASLALWAPSAVFGVVAAATAPAAPRRPWQHPWWILGVVVLRWAAATAISARIVAPFIVTGAVVADARYEPEILQGTYVVLKRRFAPAELVPGAFVMLRSPTAEGGEELARIQSTSSGIELVDGRRASPADIVGVGVPAR